MRSSALETTIQSDVTPNRLQTLGVSSILASKLTQKLVRIAIILFALVNTHCFTPQSTNAAGPAPIPGFDTWKTELLTWGETQCHYFREPGWNGGQPDPFYDGARVFYQAADYLGDPTYNGTPWVSCGDLAAINYRETQIDWVGTYGYGAAGWNKFTTGLRRHYERTGDQRSKDAVHLLATTGLDQDNPGADFDAAWTQPYFRARELAYAILAMLDDEALGAPHRARLDTLVKYAKHQYQDWFVTKVAVTNPVVDFADPTAGPVGLVPYWVGLSMEALITYNEKYPDPDIPGLIKLATDGLYEMKTNAGDGIWNANQGAFLYDTAEGKTYFSGLNMLIAPAYGWMYKRTGDTKYRDRGDEIFSQGMCGTYNISEFTPIPCTNSNGAWLIAGKQFNQTYRWTPKYIEWRQGPGNTSVAPLPPGNLRVQ